MYRLVFLDGPNKGRRITVKQGDVLIGADADSAIRLDHPSVIGRHALLEQRNGGIYLKALSALGPVQVNGQTVREHRLASGEEFAIGAMTFLYQSPEPAAVKTGRRRTSKFHRLTVTGVGLILLLQVVIVLGLIIYWRLDPIKDSIEEETSAERSVNQDVLRERLLLQCQVPRYLAPTDVVITNRFTAVPPWVVTPLIEQGSKVFNRTDDETTHVQ